MSFLIMMMSTISILIAVCDYINTANNIYIDLENNIDSFKEEVSLIDNAKCYLINYKTLDGFDYYGTSVIEDGDTYYLEFEGKTIKLNTYEGMILSYSFE